ncbi:hypothetical protein [Mycolicibacterium sp. P9-64]|uniref:hypothetical protein n=1 Tax=Mycolicibacterium sp. P9-64 TaxID=2024612 RepID=UPI001F5B5E3F|nr:hypothetical protein [Mycolicibacterium sp. P9-64]
MGRRQHMGRLRGGGSALGGLAVLAMIVVGCTSVTSGNATIDRADAPVYQASVSASAAESSASSSAQESERQASVSNKAVHTSCEALSSSSVDAIDAVNKYVDAYNKNVPDIGSTAGPAVDSLNHTADLVAGSLSSPLSPELTSALNGWVDAARAVAVAISGNASMDDFNAAIGRLNDSKTVALNLCDAAY